MIGFSNAEFLVARALLSTAETGAYRRARQKKGSLMLKFLIPSAARGGALVFYDRRPVDHALPIESFWVKVTDLNLSAACQVYAGYAANPTDVFAEMAEKWSGWSNELTWRSLEGELAFRCTHDRFGHISIQTELRPEPMPDNWRAIATITIDAGQLETIARDAVLFFGQWD